LNLDRVIRFGEFSHFGRLFTLARIFSIIEVGSTNFGQLLFHGKSSEIILRRNGQGYILGDFFANFSARPEPWFNEQKHSN
jgi:hypothetical protein